MPNWCDNRLTIIADKETVEAARASLVSGDNILSLNKMKEMPEDKAADWYNWSIENWGTKWDVSDTRGMYIHSDEGIEWFEYRFDTAWAPPIPAVDCFAKNNPDLMIHLAYDEPGMDFAGVVFWKDGEVDEEVEFACSLYSMEYNMHPVMFMELRS